MRAGRPQKQAPGSRSPVPWSRWHFRYQRAGRHAPWPPAGHRRDGDRASAPALRHPVLAVPAHRRRHARRTGSRLPREPAPVTGRTGQNGHLNDGPHPDRRFFGGLRHTRPTRTGQRHFDRIRGARRREVNGRSGYPGFLDCGQPGTRTGRGGGTTDRSGYKETFGRPTGAAGSGITGRGRSSDQRDW